MTVSYIPIGIGVSVIIMPFTALLRQFFVKTSNAKLIKLYKQQKQEDSLQESEIYHELGFSNDDFTTIASEYNSSNNSPEVTPIHSLRYLNNDETGYNSETHEMKTVSTNFSASTTQVPLDNMSSASTQNSDWLRLPKQLVEKQESKAPKEHKKSKVTIESNPPTLCGDIVINYEKCVLPKIFRYIAYILCFLWCAIFIFISLLYGIIYTTRVDNWLIVSLVTLLSDIVFIQPLKIICLVIFKECAFPRSKVAAMKMRRSQSGLL